MKTVWTSGWERCVVNDEGVHFTPLERQPLDGDWSCSLRHFLDDPRYTAHLDKYFEPGTSAEVLAAVQAHLARPTPAPAAGPSLAPPLPLAFGRDDEQARALARLAAALGAVVDPSVPAIDGGPLAWSELERGDWSEPGYRRVRLGRVVLVKQSSLNDGIGGPQESFTSFLALVMDLPAPSRVRLEWDGAQRLEVEVAAPAAKKPALLTVLGDTRFSFTPV